jgi:membrane protease YdiL (CAAX protease family)
MMSLLQPYYLLVPAFLILGTLIGLAEESAFRGYILRNFLEKYKPLTAILFASLLFGAYHIDFPSLNYYTLPFWSLYVGQALTGGLIMALFFYKTRGQPCSFNSIPFNEHHHWSNNSLDVCACRKLCSCH